MLKYYDIGDYLSQSDKLGIIRGFKSINGIKASKGWKRITPDGSYDWINQGDRKFGKFIAIGNKKNKACVGIFENYSLGVSTNRDFWIINSHKGTLKINISKTIEHYNFELKRRKLDNNISVQNDPKKIKWSSTLLNKLGREVEMSFSTANYAKLVYRPFFSQWIYFDPTLVDRPGQMPKIYPSDCSDNLTITVKGIGGGGEFNAFMTNTLFSLQPNHGTQCFPLKLYEPANDEGGLFATGETGYTERDGISDYGLKHFQDAYPDESISKEDLFYYIYGLLHSPDYRDRFKNNFSKQLPRIPCVKTAKDFWAFVDAGRKLGALHVDYETVEPYQVTIEGRPKVDADYYVTKMKFGKSGKEKDKTTIIYNDHITMKDIPLEAYEYIVNGKSALDWVMNRQCVKTDKKSGIVNDANLYATETVGNAKYPLELFQRVITVSLETMKIVNSLPPLEFEVSAPDKVEGN